MKIESKINKAKDYGEIRPTSDIEYIVVSALNNKSSTHYHVANNKAVQVIPDNCMSDTVCGPRLNKFGIYHGICTRYNSLTIGINEVDGLCVHLILTLMQRYNIPPDNVLRKLDITGEMEPDLWSNDYKWYEIKDKIKSI